jgi:two-component system alkaline phosphatase synthesis response regulator PhoP
MAWLFREKEKKKFAAKDKNVLVVDDESDIRLIIESLLINHGYSVVKARDGAEALMFLRKQHFDLMVLDIMMPHVDGYQVMESLKEINPELPVVMLTAKSTDKDVWEGYARGCHYYITKPFTNETLIRGVNYLLNNLSEAQRTDLEKRL